MNARIDFRGTHIAKKRAGSHAKFDHGTAPGPFESGVIAACERDGTTHYYHIGEEQKDDFEFWAMSSERKLLVDSDGIKDGELVFLDQFDMCEVSTDCPE
jgi:hypothetical protein